MWNTKQLRLTAFAQTNDRAAEESWWPHLFGAAPATRTTRTSESAFQDEGSFKDGNLTLLVVPGRVDWIWIPVLGPDFDKGTLPSLGELSETAGQFQNLMDSWLDLAPRMYRLAFGAVLDQPVSSKKDAYQLLQTYLPAVHLDTENSSDFLYRINRPVASRAITGHHINRLSTWAALVAIMKAGPVDRLAVQREYFAARLEVDVNTFAEPEIALTKQNAKDVLGELITLAQEIAKSGDQPT